MPSNVKLADLIEADGFNSGAGKIQVSSWLEYIQKVKQMANIKEGESIYEVGCGAGAFLYPFYGEGYQVGGCDYSHSLVEASRKVMSGMDIVNCEANQFSTTAMYDIVLSNSVFQYFPDEEYAASVVEKMWRKARKAVAILDINDPAYKEEAIRIRRASLPPGEYEVKYQGLDHLYLSRQFFDTMALNLGGSIQYFDQEVKGYGNNHFRYNVVITR